MVPATTRGVQGDTVPCKKIGLVMVAVFLLAEIVLTTPAHAVAPASAELQSAAAHPQPAESAVAQAQRTGKPVEVSSSLTETSSVVANPNGTFTMRSNAKPVRVKKNDAWQDIDTNLVTRPDGSLAPVATPLDLTFSGGGSTPLVTVADGTKKVSLSWPAELPTPTINGSSAIYPSVLPGIDLQVTADSTSFSEVLIVRDAVAARNPALANITFTVSGYGLNLDAAADGTFSAKDSSGHTVFTSSTPMMWDSSHKGGTTPSATDPGEGRLFAINANAKKTVAARGNVASTMDVTLTPDPARLLGPDVRYPVYLDPSMSRTSEAWAEVADNGWHYFNDAMDAQVGRCEWDRCGTPVWVARSFFQIPTNDLMSRNGVQARIFEASFFALQTHGTSCVAEPTDLYLTGPISAATRWAGPGGSFVSQAASSAGDQCGGARWVKFDAASAAQYAVQYNAVNLTFGLRAPDEGQKLQWKKFANNPHFDVVFSFPPNHATGLRVSNAVNCGDKTVTPDSFPTFYATATDNNAPPLNLNLGLQAWKLGQGATEPTAKSPPVQIASGSQGSWQSDVSLSDGPYVLMASVQNVFPDNAARNLDAAGGVLQYHSFTARPTPIAQIPIITSTDYPAQYWGQPQTLPGRVTFDTNGAPNIVGFTYTFAGSGTETVPKTTDCAYTKTFGATGGWVTANGRTATITIPPGLSPGRNTLHVRSFDDAHKLSPESPAYTFYLPPTLTPVAPTVRIEGESLPYDADPGVTVSTVNSTVPGVSGGKYLRATSSAEEAWTSLEVRVAVEGDYNIAAMMVGGPADHAVVAFFLDSQWIGEESGFFYGSTPETPALRPMNFRLTGVHLTAGSHWLQLWATGMSPDQNTWQFGLDYLQLTPTVKLDLEAMPQLRSDAYIDPAACCDEGINNGGTAIFQATAVNQSVSVRLTVPVEADYVISAVILKLFYFGQYTIDIDGKPLARTDVQPIDGYIYPFPKSVHQPLGGMHLTAGDHTLTIKVVGKHPDSESYAVGIDYISVLPINNATAASFTDAMNNKGISSDGAVSSLDLSNNSLSRQTLAAAGLQPGSTVNVSGAKFTMPAPNPTTGNDNVIATGQTIPFPTGQQVKANAVGLLVTSTCGGAPPVSGTITYTDGTTSNPLFPAIADWAAGPTDYTTAVLPYRNTSAGPDSQYGPRIYAIFPPADPTKTLKSITLPNYGTSFISGCPQNATHVLAMAPRPVAAGWIGAWTAPPDGVIPVTGFSNATVRSVIRPSTTGPNVRIKLSNTDNLPVTIGAASIAAHSGTGAATVGTPVQLTFGGTAAVTLPAGGEIYSDPVPAPTGGNSNLVVSAHLPNQVTKAPVHASATTPSYLAAGNSTADKTGTPFAALTGTYYITGIDVSTADTAKGTVVALSDRSTSTGASDGAKSTWVDGLPGKLSGTSTPVPGGLVNGSLANLAATRAPDLLQRTTAGVPNLRTVIVSLGANDILAGRSATAIQQDLRALLKTENANGLRRLSRSDGSPIRLILTTVPPLGLDANDQREKERQLLNAVIRLSFGDLGSDHLVDFDQAVRDAANPSKIAASYLTGNAPNSAYHDKLAQTLADAITRFPPEAQL
jgi:hypothetical protein